MTSDRRAIRRGWTDADRSTFADRDILRASTVPGRRRMPPAVAEYLDELAAEAEAELDPPSYVSVSVEVGGETALDHVDRIGRDDDLLANIARTIGVAETRITIIITVDQ